MNVLLTSAGRRSSLLQAFQAAAHPWGMKVFVSEVDPLAPACALADGAFQVPRLTDPNHLSCLLSLIRSQAVSLVVPTIDTELPLLAAQAQALREAGAFAMVSTPDFVATCADKWRTFLAFQGQGVKVPQSWIPGELPGSLPGYLFVKPRNGSSSLDTHACRREELDHVLPLVPEPIIQELLLGQEVTTDAFLDFEGRPIHFVPRARIRTLGGESIQGVTLDDPAFDAWMTRVLGICGTLGARGAITLQAFHSASGPVLTEVNPRFGGGYPLARAAGGDYPAWMLALLRGEPLPPRLGEYRRGLYMTRHYSEIFLEALPWERPGL